MVIKKDSTFYMTGDHHTTLDKHLYTASDIAGTWTSFAWDTTGSPAVDTSILTLNSGERMQSTTLSTLSLYKALRFRANWKSGGNLKWIGFISGMSGARTIMSTSSAKLYLKNYVSDTASDDVEASVSDAYKIYEITWESGKTKGYVGDVLEATLTSQVPTSSLPVTIYNYNDATYDLLVDWVFVRNYTSPEPSTSVGSEQTLYSTDNSSIQPTAANSLTFTSLSEFTETTTPHGGEIKYILSNNDGSTWKYYSSGWAVSDETYNQANTAIETNSNISTFSTGSGNFLFKAFLHSDGTQLVQLDNVAVGYSSNSAPSATFDNDFSTWKSGNVTVNYNLIDSESNTCNISQTASSGIEYSTDNSTWHDAADGGGTSEGLTGLAGSASPGTNHIFVWNTSTDLPTTEDSTVYLRIRPNDGTVDADDWVTSNAFGVDNVAPTNVGISSVTADSTSQITITANTATDSESGLHAAPYWFEETSGNTGASSSTDWQESNVFIDDGLRCGTQYSYRVKARDAAGNISNYSSIVSLSTNGCGGGGLPSVAYNPPTSPAGGFGISINNNAPQTYSPIVTLNLKGGSDTARMAISNFPDFRDAIQEPYQSTKLWTLSEGEGTEQVYVKFYTQYGYSSEPVSDTIVYKKETTKPEPPEKTIPIEKPTKPPTAPEVPETPTPPITPPTTPTLPELKPDKPIFTSTQGNIIVEPIFPQEPLKLTTGLALKASIKPSKPVIAVKVIIIFEESDGSNSLNNGFFSTLFDIPFAYAQLWQVAEYTLYDEDGDGVFEGEIEMPKVIGKYTIRTTLYYEDGTIKDIEKEILIDPKGYVYQAVNGKELRIPEAIISIYAFNSITNQFELWQAQNYDQENPQITDKTGEYEFLVPEGKYYLTITAPDYQDYQSEEFEAKEGNVINRNIELTPIKKFDWRLLIFPVIFGVLALGIIIDIFIRLKRR